MNTIRRPSKDHHEGYLDVIMALKMTKACPVRAVVLTGRCQETLLGETIKGLRDPVGVAVG